MKDECSIEEDTSRFTQAKSFIKRLFAFQYRFKFQKTISEIICMEHA